ncbi:MAG: protease inhibitor I42 family protein [Spirochaetes bacterium]|nr:protease inhibitor I42 family protein [Spirochaetota bacterium]
MIGTAVFNKTLMLAMIVSAAMMCSCSVKPAVTVTEADNGAAIDIKSGEILEVRLPAQLGTGFGWKVLSAGTNLAQKGEPEQVSGGGEKPGGPELQSFKFKAGEKGESELTLQYAEGWKKDAKPLRDFRVTVNVK